MQFQELDKQNNIMKTQYKTMQFISYLTIKFCLQTEKNNKKVKKQLNF